MIVGLRRAFSPDPPAREGLILEASVALAAAFIVLFIIAFVPSMLDSVYEIIDQLICKKSESDSFAERSMWTRVGMEAFYATGGLGVGLGSERASNWYVGILSNTGIIEQYRYYRGSASRLVHTAPLYPALPRRQHDG